MSRFFTEANVMVELNHPNIRQVYDYGNIDGRPAIIKKSVNNFFQQRSFFIKFFISL